jgi:predicted dehydrogenase
MLGLATKYFEGVEAAAICDHNPAAADRVRADLPDVPFFAHLDEMLEKVAPDALLVEVPPAGHAQCAIKALERDIHVLCDIPAVDRAEEAAPLWKAQESSRAMYMMGANTNRWAFVETAVDLKRKGLLGDPYYIEAEYIHDIRSLFERTPWRATFEPIKYCTHSLGPMLRLIDEDLSLVSCFDTGSHINHLPDQHDAMAALLRTPSNVVVRLLCSFINNCPDEGHRYRVYCTKGYFERTPAYDGPGSARTLFYSTELYGPRRYTELPVAEMRPEDEQKPGAKEHGGADFALFDRFFEAIRKGLPSPTSLREGLRMSLPGIYAAQSARSGGALTRIVYPWTGG